MVASHTEEATFRVAILVVSLSLETEKESEKILPVVVAPPECHPGHRPRHGHRQRSSLAANTKGRGYAETSTWDEEHATTDNRLWRQAMAGRNLGG
uniref:Uncharacterized protein n=1 Tax=Oryza punctata TaxID=4537 RepID=A0A0E0KLX5_ORYPU